MIKPEIKVTVKNKIDDLYMEGLYRITEIYALTLVCGLIAYEQKSFGLGLFLWWMYFRFSTFEFKNKVD